MKIYTILYLISVSAVLSNDDIRKETVFVEEPIT